MSDLHDDHDDEDGRSEQVRNALLKALGLVVVVGVLIALGTTFMVHALGLNQSDDDGPVGSSTTASPSTPLPSTALPVPGESSGTPTEEPTQSPSPSSSANGDIELSISPLSAKPMQRVDLTGSYPGADNVSLEVQRFADGTWTNFGVQAQVKVGTFATYVMTGRSGENRFRVFDPQAKKGSNVILVTIG